MPDAPPPGTNGWGLFDVHGNVWQWCQDWCGLYPSAEDGRVVQRWRAARGACHRVLRGGRYRGGAFSCRTAERGRNGPGWVGVGDYGFRVGRVGPGVHG